MSVGASRAVVPVAALVAAALVAATSACALVLGLSRNDGASDGGAGLDAVSPGDSGLGGHDAGRPRDAASDRSAVDVRRSRDARAIHDASPDIVARTDSGLMPCPGAGFCNCLTKSPLLCEDFDEPDALGGWGQVAEGGAVVALAQDDAASPPSCVSCTARAVKGSEALITRDVTVPLGAQGLTLAFDLRVVGCNGGPGYVSFTGVIGLADASSPALLVGATDAGGPGLLLGYTASSSQGAGWSGYPAPIPANTWTRVTLSIYLQTSGLVGATAATFGDASASYEVPNFTAFPAAVTVVVGAQPLYAEGCDVEVDNVVLTST